MEPSNGYMPTAYVFLTQHKLGHYAAVEPTTTKRQYLGKFNFSVP